MSRTLLALFSWALTLNGHRASIQQGRAKEELQNSQIAALRLKHLSTLLLAFGPGCRHACAVHNAMSDRGKSFLMACTRQSEAQTKTDAVSLITRTSFFGRPVFVKRDDLLQLGRGRLNGNKARKLAWLEDYLHGRSSADETDQLVVKSWGGAQSNSMVALARLCSAYDVAFEYYTHPIPKWLRSNPSGNYKAGLEYGMSIVEVARSEDLCEAVTGSHQGDDGRLLVVPQGGADARCADGFVPLALELLSFVGSENSSGQWRLIVESGTGATALFAAAALAANTRGMTDHNIKVVAVPVVGDARYCLQQMQEMWTDQGQSLDTFPTNLHVMASEDSAVFARPEPHLLQLHTTLTTETQLDWDMIYFPRAMERLKPLLARRESISSQAGLDTTAGIICDGERIIGCEDHLIYLHCGGCEGNDSMRDRYRHAGML